MYWLHKVFQDYDGTPLYQYKFFKFEPKKNGYREYYDSETNTIKSDIKKCLVTDTAVFKNKSEFLFWYKQNIRYGKY